MGYQERWMQKSMEASWLPNSREPVLVKLEILNISFNTNHNKMYADNIHEMKHFCISALAHEFYPERY